MSLIRLLNNLKNNPPTSDIPIYDDEEKKTNIRRFF